MSSCSQNNLVLISTQNHKTKNPHGLPKGYISQRLLKDTQVHEGCSQTCSKMLNSVFGRKRIRQQLISHTHTHPTNDYKCFPVKNCPPSIQALETRPAQPVALSDVFFKSWKQLLLLRSHSQKGSSGSCCCCSCSQTSANICSCKATNVIGESLSRTGTLWQFYPPTLFFHEEKLSTNSRG